MIWKKEAGLFVDAVDYDILQQQHFGQISENGTAIKLDYMMFLDNPLDANEIAFIKIIQTETEEDPNPKLSAADTQLEILGVSQFNEALFRFSDRN